MIAGAGVRVNCSKTEKQVRGIHSVQILVFGLDNRVGRWNTHLSGTIDNLCIQTPFFLRLSMIFLIP